MKHFEERRSRVGQIPEQYQPIPMPPGQSDHASAPASQPRASWSAEQQIALESALKQFPSALPTNERWDRIAEYTGRSRGDCAARYKECAARARAEKKKAQVLSSLADGATLPVTSLAKTDWTDEQQRALLRAAQQFPANRFRGEPGQRWRTISDQVPGKDHTECEDRYRALLRNPELHVLRTVGRAKQAPPKQAEADATWKEAYADELLEAHAKVQLVRNHSTHLEGLWPVLEGLQVRLTELGGFKKIIPAQLSNCQRQPVQKLELVIREETSQGFELRAKKGESRRSWYSFGNVQM